MKLYEKLKSTIVGLSILCLSTCNVLCDDYSTNSALSTVDFPTPIIIPVKFSSFSIISITTDKNVSNWTVNAIANVSCKFTDVLKSNYVHVTIPNVTAKIYIKGGSSSQALKVSTNRIIRSINNILSLSNSTLVITPENLE